MRLFITDKPSTARAIADALPGPAIHEEGFIRVGDDAVTWTDGPAIQLGIDEGSGNTSSLKTSKLVWRTETKPQLRIVKSLLDRASVVVHAGPPSCQGQMWIDDAVRFLRHSGASLRLLMHATDSESIKNGLSQLVPNATFRDSARVARFELEADWLFAWNLTPAVCKRLGIETALRLGRLEWPTLALIAQRDREVEHSAVTSYLNNELTLETEDGPIALTIYPPACELGVWDSAEVQDLDAKLSGLEFATVKVSETVQTEPPPKPFSLATFQAAANSRYRWSAAKSLELARSLYDTKNQLVSFPVTDSRYLPPEQAADALRIARHIVEHRPFAMLKPLLPLLAPRPAVYDARASKRNDPSDAFERHALVPTVRPADFRRLTPDQQNAWMLIAEQFLMSLLPSHEIAVTTVSFSLDESGKGGVLEAIGEVSLNQSKSWRALAPCTYRALPLIQDGARLRCLGHRIVEHQARKFHFTEETLIERMSRCGEPVIGNAETRTEVIESLKRSGCVIVREGMIISTEQGRAILEQVSHNVTDRDVVSKWGKRIQLLSTQSVDEAAVSALKQELEEEVMAEVVFVHI